MIAMLETGQVDQSDAIRTLRGYISKCKESCLPIELILDADKIEGSVDSVRCVMCMSTFLFWLRVLVKLVNFIIKIISKFYGLLSFAW